MIAEGIPVICCRDWHGGRGRSGKLLCERVYVVVTACSWNSKRDGRDRKIICDINMYKGGKSNWRMTVSMRKRNKNKNTNTSRLTGVRREAEALGRR